MGAYSNIAEKLSASFGMFDVLWGLRCYMLCAACGVCTNEPQWVEWTKGGREREREYESKERQGLHSEQNKSKFYIRYITVNTQWLGMVLSHSGKNGIQHSTAYQHITLSLSLSHSNTNINVIDYHHSLCHLSFSFIVCSVSRWQISCIFKRFKSVNIAVLWSRRFRQQKCVLDKENRTNVDAWIWKKGHFCGTRFSHSVSSVGLSLSVP